MKAIILFFFFSITLVLQAQEIDVQHYRFEVELSNTSDAINGKATVTVQFLRDLPVLQLQLVKGNDEKGMYVFGVKEGPVNHPFTHQGTLLQVMLKTPAKAGEKRSFEISYMGSPKDGLIISKNKFEERTFFSDHWPNRAHHWLPVNDRPDDKASFEFIVTAPAGYDVVSNGERISRKTLTDGRLQTHWKETTPLSTKIMAIGVARFAIKQFTGKESPVPVSAWVYPQDSAKLFYDYAVAPSILQFFSSYIAPFPYSKLANVQSTTIFGGMENAGSIFYSENLVSGKRLSEDVVAHEIAHQWFGDAASEKSFAHLWLSEGFATYLTNYYFEKRYGADSAASRRKEEREQVAGYVMKSDRPVVDSTSDLMSLLNANSYQKGGWILHMLRKEVGDTAFQKILQQYYQQFKGKNADSKDFEAIAEAVSGKELTPFFNQWLYRSRIPVLDIRTKVEGDELKLHITQEGVVYTMPIEIGLVTTDGKMEIRTFQLDTKDFMFKGRINSLKSVVIDPNVNLLYRVR